MTLPTQTEYPPPAQLSSAQVSFHPIPRIRNALVQFSSVVSASHPIPSHLPTTLHHIPRRTSQIQELYPSPSSSDTLQLTKTPYIHNKPPGLSSPNRPVQFILQYLVSRVASDLHSLPQDVVSHLQPPTTHFFPLTLVVPTVRADLQRSYRYRVNGYTSYLLRLDMVTCDKSVTILAASRELSNTCCEVY